MTNNENDIQDPDWWMDDECRYRRKICFEMREFFWNLRKDFFIPEDVKEGDEDYWMYGHGDWWMDDYCLALRAEVYKKNDEKKEQRKREGVLPPQKGEEGYCGYEPGWWMNDRARERKEKMFAYRASREKLCNRNTTPTIKEGDPDWYMYATEDWWMDDQCRKVREEAEKRREVA